MANTGVLTRSGACKLCRNTASGTVADDFTLLSQSRQVRGH
jgi:hypothetical protein